MKLHSRRCQTPSLLWMVLIVLVLGCAPTIEKPLQPGTTIIPSATLPVITYTSIPSKGVEVVSTPTTQAIVEVSLEEDCIPIEEQMPSDLILSGVWVRGSRNPYLENIQERTKYQVPLKGGGVLETYPLAGDFAISPDGRHLAYIDPYRDPAFRTEKRILRIINSAGHSFAMDFWLADWQWILGWIDNQNIALSLGTRDEKGIVVLNPFTGSWRKFEQPEWVKDKISRWSNSYIPVLNWFVDYSNSPYLLLKDLKTGNTVGKTENWGGFTWSRDGSTLAVVSTNSVELISKNGAMTEFDISDFETDRWGELVLSADGQKLFFSMGYPEKLFFVDFKTAKIEALCPGEYDLGYGNYPFWSPDNRFVVLGAYDTGYYSTYDPYDILVDTQQIQAYKLPTQRGHERLAWLPQP